MLNIVTHARWSLIVTLKKSSHSSRPKCYLVMMTENSYLNRLVLSDTFPIFVTIIKLSGLRLASTSAKSTAFYCKSRWPNLRQHQVQQTCGSGEKFPALKWIIGLLREQLSPQLKNKKSLRTLSCAVQLLVSINSATGCATLLTKANGQPFQICLLRILMHQEPSKFS